MAFGRQLHQASANFAQQPKQVRISHSSPNKCEFRTAAQASANFAPPAMQVWILHQPMRLWCEISSVFPTPHEIFSFVFFDVHSFLISVISQSQALLCKDYKMGGNHLSEHMLCFTLSKNTGRSLLSFSLYYFLFLGSQTTSEDVFPEDERLNFWFLGVKEARWKVQMQKWKTLVH